MLGTKGRKVWGKDNKKFLKKIETGEVPIYADIKD